MTPRAIDRVTTRGDCERCHRPHSQHTGICASVPNPNGGEDLCPSYVEPLAEERQRLRREGRYVPPPPKAA